MSTRLPSFIVTLATFFVLRGLNLGVTKQITDTVRVAGLDQAPGYDSAARIFASDFWSPYNYRITVIWWIGFTILATWSSCARASATGSSPSAATPSRPATSAFRWPA